MPLLYPLGVHPKDRKLAWIIYGFLVAGFIAFAVIAIVAAFGARDDPPTQFKLSKKTYDFPMVTFCAFDSSDNVVFLSTDCSYELESANNPSTCTATVYTETHDDPSDNRPCVRFNQNRPFQLKTTEGDVLIQTTFTFNFPSGDVGLEGLDVYLHEKVDSVQSDDPNNQPSTFQIPYRRGTVMKIAREERKDLKDNVAVNYRGTLVPVPLSNENLITGGNTTIGYAALQIKLDSVFVAEVNEVDPVSVTTLLGVVSGFWNYVSLAFALLFVGVGWQENRFGIQQKIRFGSDPPAEHVGSNGSSSVGPVEMQEA